jgi:hypothetical protein
VVTNADLRRTQKDMPRYTNMKLTPSAFSIVINSESHSWIYFGHLKDGPIVRVKHVFTLVLRQLFKICLEIYDYSAVDS